MSDTENEEIPYNPEVVIFPNRLCSDETVAKFLMELKKIDGITKVIMHGPRTYDLIKRVIKVGKSQELILDIQVGKFFIEIDQPEVVLPIREAADKCFTFGYRIGAGRFTKYRKTTMDDVRGYSLVFRKDILERDLDE
ncbi:MAG: methyl-coenzyme M reductase operon protein D [Candidatus Helarchaeota archaeon]